MKSKYFGMTFPAVIPQTPGVRRDAKWKCIAFQNVICTRHKIFFLTNGYTFVILWDNVMPHLAKGEVTVDELIAKRLKHFDKVVELMGRTKVYCMSIV